MVESRVHDIRTQILEKERKKIGFLSSELQKFKNSMDSESLSCRHFAKEKRAMNFLCNFHGLSLQLSSIDQLCSVREAMRGLSMREFSEKLEPFLRNVVREELERGILRHSQSSARPSVNHIEASGSRGWRLHFTNKLPHTIFTGSRIEAENGTLVQIVILDANSKNIITCGPLSSIKVDILVLDGDFGTDEQEDWTEKEFDSSVIREREGKRPLVTGDLVVTLRGGVGYLGDIAFTDNSSWIRSRKFRLGARIMHSTCPEGRRIREARSEAFIVKDHRGESYKKHHPPSLGDEVWRLERIGKDGAFHNRLAFNRINTVQDFLQLLVTDPCLLRNILGNGMSNKTWETIVHHASACDLDNKIYMYYSAAQRVGLLFNSVYKVVGAIFDGQSYHPLDNLTTSQMMLVEDLKRHAYKNVKDIVEICEPLIDGPSRPLPRLQATFFPGSSQDVLYPDFPITLQDQVATPPSFNHVVNSSPFIVDRGVLEEVAVTQDRHPVQVFTPIQRNSFNMRDSCTAPYVNGGSEWATGGLSGPVVPGGCLTGGDMSQVQWQSWFPATTTQGHGNELIQGSNDEVGIGLLSSLPDLSVHISSCKRNMGWLKLRAAVKWGISGRRGVAARRRARQFSSVAKH